MELTRDNHFVPESYLKRWAGEDHKLWSYRTLVSDSRVPCWKKVSPRGVAYHRHLYTQILQGEETDALEQWFNTDYESPAQQAIHKAVSDSRMRPEDWVLLVRYLALQDLRTPARMLEMLERAHDNKGTTIAEILEDAVQNLEESHRSGKPLQQEAREEVEDFPFPIALEFKPLPDQGVVGVRAHQLVGRQWWLFHLKHLLRGTATALHQHDWTILKPWPGMSWITSDNPVVKLNYTSATEYDLNGGWGNDRANIFMPLGPQHLFFTEIGARRWPRGTVLEKARTVQLRKMLAENAHRMVFSTTPESWVEESRPRAVSAPQFEQERQLWRGWAEEQKQAELDLEERKRAARPDLDEIRRSRKR